MTTITTKDNRNEVSVGKKQNPAIVYVTVNGNDIALSKTEAVQMAAWLLYEANVTNAS